jgi:hypothetical protein
MSHAGCVVLDPTLRAGAHALLSFGAPPEVDYSNKIRTAPKWNPDFTGYKMISIKFCKRPTNCKITIFYGFG